MKKQVALLAFGLLVGCASSPETADDGTERAEIPIINGETFTDENSLESPSVYFELCIENSGDPNVLVPHEDCIARGSGVLIQWPGSATSDVVLTARHVIDPAPEYPFHTVLVVNHGNRTIPDHRRTRILGVPKIYSSKVFTTGEILRDIALVFLEDKLARPQTMLPDLACGDPDPEVFQCHSGIHHLLTPSNAVLTLPQVINRATLDRYPPPALRWAFSESPYHVHYGPTNKRTIFQGDSGGGCLDFFTDRLAAVTSNTPPPTPLSGLLGGKPPLSKIGRGQRVSFYCRWINQVLERGKVLAFEAQSGDGDTIEDMVAITQIADDSHVLTIDRSRFSDQTFEVTIADSHDLRGGAVGSFTGGRPALALSAGGTLTAVPFNGGPTPLVSGAPSAQYGALAKVRLNSDSADDLIAERATGELDAFVGSPTGLQYAPSIRPIGMRLDRDRLPDYVWFDGPTIRSFSTVDHDANSSGSTQRTLIPNTLNVVQLAAGVFHDLKATTRGELDGGIQDIVALSSPATGGAVVWCKSTGFGLQCSPALDWEDSSGRIATSIEVADVDGDLFDDVVVSYSNENTSPRTFLGSPTGFDIDFGRGVRAAGGGDFNGDGVDESFTITSDPENDVGPPSGDMVLSVRVPGVGVFGPFNLDIPFVEPVSAVLGNFNGDEAEAPAATAHHGGLHPVMDMAIISGGRVFALISNGDGSFAVNEPTGSTGYVAIGTIDATGDGIDDLEAMRADGSVTVFAGVSGSGQGLEAVGQNFTGLPTPDTGDGEMLVLSGLGVSTVAATEARFKLTVGPEDTANLDRLTVQIFDGNNEGLHQFESETNVLKTCYSLSADPCGDSNLGSCNGGGRPAVHLATVSSDTLNDDVWDTIFDQAHSSDASLPGDGTPPFIYSLHVYLSEDCAVLPAPNTTIPIATADAFKVRSNAMVSHPAGELSFVGSDSDGDFGVSGTTYMADTAFDGTFSLPISVGPSATEIQLKEADADDTTDATPGFSLAPNPEIQYRLLRPNGTAASMVGAEDATATTLVTNPSGNNDGTGGGDVETRIASIGASTPGTWTWQWEGVKASNAVHVFGPFGSPTTHEVLGARRLRPTTTTAEQPYFWEDTTELTARLPIVLGTDGSDGAPIGDGVVVATATEAAAFLANAAATPEGELERQLLVSKLNCARGLELGEDLRGGLVYGTTISVRTAIRRAEEAVAGTAVWAGVPAERDRLISLLSSVNLGHITYLHPGVPFPEQPMADDDGDLVLNVKDNCPSVANPDQADTIRDGIGDACQVRPIGPCLLQRTETTFDAFFGYENPLTFRSIPVGWRNGVERPDTWLDAGQPTEFLGGTQRGAFHLPFDTSETISWTLDGQTVEVSGATAPCSGRELTRASFASRVALLATEGIELGDYASVAGLGGLPTVVSGADLTVGANAVVGDLIAGGRAVVGSLTLVRGGIATGLGLDRQVSAVVEGPLVDRVTVPRHSLGWHLVYERSGAAVNVGHGAEQRLTPGTYGDVVVEAGATLVLEPGRYQLASLFVAKQGTLLLGSGEVVVHVADSLDHLGETRRGDATSSLTLGYFGTAPATVAASLHGAAVAPKAELVLGSTLNAVYSGSFAARKIVVGAGTIVEYSSL